MKKYDEGEKSPSASDITRFEFVKSAYQIVLEK